jgi:fructose-bisphosphate aldolase, class II
MITNLKSILEVAKANKQAVGSFNVYNYETIRGVIEAAKEMKVPAIIAFGEKYLVNMELKEVVNLIRTMTLDMEFPVAIHLDHCKSVPTIKKAIEAGFTSVMIDGSELPFEENVRVTKEVVDFAHLNNVSVEAELGCIELGDHSNEDEGETIYTDPAQAKEFVELTQVDALAISIGTVHGMYKGEPKISVERLKEIKALVDIPFVLHGGSGTPDQTVQTCIDHGICKINVNTEISYHVVEEFKKAIANNPKIHFSNLSTLAVDSAKEVVKKYMTIFNNEK